jgi:cyanamide hydratase
MSVNIVSPILRELDVSVVERDLNAQMAAQSSLFSTKPRPISLASIPVPSTSLTTSALRYAHDSLDSTMFNHSNRVFFIGKAMHQHPALQHWHVDDEAYYLTSLLHDIGVGPGKQLSTRLSFEFHGAILARDFILQHGGDHAIADEVCEAIIRHTNFVKGKLTTTSQLIQLSTTCDVIGSNTTLIHSTTYSDIATKWPRLGFNQHFARLMEEEMVIKPWSHTTTVQEENGFCAKIRGNPFTKEFDQEAVTGKNE